MHKATYISQAVLPVEMNPFATAANRFQHGVGVWYLAQRLCERPEFAHLDPVLPLAGLLHDAGNPPFSHTGDWFMREAIGCDGETRLAELLAGSELAGALDALGADPEMVAAFVAGRTKPWSLLLNGSLDLDNADNVRRYARASGIARADYDPRDIADVFCVSSAGDGIELSCAAQEHVWAWQRARRRVYESVYDDPHLVLAVMLHRAVGLAHLAGELPREFWSFTDQEAFHHLGQCNAGTASLVGDVRRLRPYQLVAEWSSSYESLGFPWHDWRIRKAVGDEIAEACGLEPWEAVAYLGAGKDFRKIELPFRDASGGTRQDRMGGPPIYRIRIYLRRSGPRGPAIRDVSAFCRTAIQSRLPARSQSFVLVAEPKAGF